MKKLVSLMLLFILPLTTACAEKYQEGKQYTVVSEKASTKPEVREYFSFYCPHCLRFEPVFAEIKKHLPANASFERNHVDFLRAASPEVQFILTKAIVVAQQLGMEEKLTASLFNYIQVQHATFASEKDVRNLFVLNGVDGDQFDKMINSFTVVSQAKLMKKNQDYFSKNGALTGVPTIIVNGRYRINPAELDKNNFEQDYQKLINYLLTLNNNA